VQLAFNIKSLTGDDAANSNGHDRAGTEMAYPPNPTPERKLEVCEGLMDVASALFNVCGKDLRRPGRSTKPIARIRQITMYVAHCTLGLTMTDIGTGFGRDRTTVLHACHLIEDMRDDIEFDRIVTTFERVALAAFGNRYGVSR
jgi:hypothetical protein